MSWGSLSQFSPNLQQPIPTMATLSRIASGLPMTRGSYDPRGGTASLVALWNVASKHATARQLTVPRSTGMSGIPWGPRSVGQRSVETDVHRRPSAPRVRHAGAARRIDGDVGHALVARRPVRRDEPALG